MNQIAGINAISCHAIPDFETLSVLEPEWWSLWRSCPQATPFQSPAWLLPWWQAFHPGELATLALRRGNRLVGLAPFYRETGAMGRRLLPIGISLSDYQDVLLSPDCAAEGAASIVSHMEGRADWDSWEIGELHPDAAFLSLPVPAGATEECHDAAFCSYRTWGESGPGFSKSRRAHIRLAMNRALRMGEVEILRGDSANAAELLEELFRLHALRWSRRGEPDGLLADGRVASFHRQAVPALLSAGLLKLYGLRIAGQTAGAFYTLLHGRRSYGYMIGFDPDYAFVSPGTTLIAHAIEEAAREGAFLFDFLRGDESYKTNWATAGFRNRRRAFHRMDGHARH